MKRTIMVDHPAFSINKMYNNRRSFGTSAAFKQWTAGLFHKLSTEQNLQSFTDLREFFNPKSHCFNLDLTFTFPSKVYYTKEGQMSARCFDISNIEKPLIDLIFLPEYYKKPSPYGCKNLNIDDKYIRSMRSRKISGDMHRIQIDIEIQSL